MSIEKIYHKLNLKRLGVFNIKFAMKALLLDMYNRLYGFFGPQHWWPADTKDEVIIGAILTQNTAWNNVERAIDNLKRLNLLSLEAIDKTDLETLKKAIKPAGFFNQKAGYLKNMAHFVSEYGGLKRLSQLKTRQLRALLLSVKGIGKETADSILLYAFNRPMFVVDAYTKRLMRRHKLLDEFSYDAIQRFFMDNLPCDTRLFNEYHALIVKLAKVFCKSKPSCRGCPLEDFL